MMAGPPFKLGGKKPDIELNKPEGRQPGKLPAAMVAAYLVFGVLAFFLWRTSAQLEREQIPYSQFLRYVESGQVDTAVVSDNLIRGTLTLRDSATHHARRFITVPLPDDELARLLSKHNVAFTVHRESHWLSNLLGWLLPIGFLVVLWIWMSSRMTGAQGILKIGGNKVHIHPDSLPKVTFEDVAGVEEAKQELTESIEFLRDPSRIQRLGGHMPKGLLLVGPPGTGKTLLARAVAGEAEVPFFNISGSEFIEMFVGVGAARVRDLFQQARRVAPCIVFIDELDAIGRSRGGPVAMGGHDEREQTLNQILTEMDGFDPSTGVVVMAATNRPEILDKALLRAGRFDRQIIVDKPDLVDRLAILRLHVRNLHLAPDVDLNVVAQRTPGFVGADLANIANEAAILGVRRNHDAIMMADFEAAIDRVIAGPEKKHRVLGPAEKRRVAFHESGHTLVARSVPTGAPVHKVSIIPRGVAALGYTMQLPVEEKFLSTQSELEDQLAVLLGGRSAEEIVFGDISSGASNDLERATAIARSMVCQLGMSEALGPLTYGKKQEAEYLGIEFGEQRDFSDETARLIDDEVKRLVDHAHESARDVLNRRRHVLDALAAVLEQKEVISGEEVDRIISEAEPETG